MQALPRLRLLPGPRGRITRPVCHPRAVSTLGLPCVGVGKIIDAAGEFFHHLADVHWLPDGELLVPYQNFDADDGTTRHWHLLRMTSDGQRLAEVREVPRLLEVDGRRGALFFVDPEAEAPNRWLQARLR